MTNLRKIILAVAAVAVTTVSAQQLAYQNPSLSSLERAKDLCSRLTIEEKAQIMIDRSKEVKRMQIPQFEWWNEALHGVGRNGMSTVYPITMCMASSWNDLLLYKVFCNVSDELRAKNTIARHNGTLERYRGNSVWTPNINIFRDPRWGRGQETYGEDPYLTERMGLAVVAGLQGTDLQTGELQTKYYKNLACAKHFAVHSGPEWNRHYFNVEDLPARDLWETYLPAFKSLVQKGNVREVMCAYQRLDGDPCCGSNRLLQQILRDEWKFNGIVVSDCGAVNDFWVKGRHGVSTDAKTASTKAVLSGTDVECGSNYLQLPKAVKDGIISEAQVDESVIKLLQARFELGDFDADSLVEWTSIPASVIACDEHRQDALDMARQGIVLLQNNNNILPLKKSSKIAVVGPNADNEMMMWGNYNGFPLETVTLLKGIKALGGDVKYVGGVGFTRNETMHSLINEMTTASGAKGMLGTYWNNTEMQGVPTTTATYANTINLNNGGYTVFAPGVELENFSARYEGTLHAKKTQTLALTCNADDRMRVIVNGDTLCNNWKTRNSINRWNGELEVKEGEDYNITVEYMQSAGYASLTFDIADRQTAEAQDIVNQTADCDVVVFCGGISPQLEGEEMKVNEPGFKGGDRTSIELPQSQRDIIKALADAGRKIVYVNCSGCCVGLTPEAARCDGMIQAWYPGEKGGQALAEIIFGDVNPSGKLPVTFYKDDTQLPDFLDYTMQEGKNEKGETVGRTYRYFKGEPLFRFGHGLSYTTFKKDNVKIKKDKQGCSVLLDITNTGTRDGDDIVQVYLKNPKDAEGPIKTLRAFQRVSLKAGETKQLSIRLEGDQLLWWDASSNTMQPLKKYNVEVE